MASTPMPPPVNPPSPPPPPPPPPAQSPAIFPNITTNTDFATLGLHASSSSIPVNSLVRDGFSVKFDAASNSYLIGLPSTASSTFLVPSNAPSDPNYWEGYLGPSGGNFAVLKPSANQLSYTSLGVATNYYTSDISFLAFGSATPSSGVPLSGTATFGATVVGATQGAPATNYPGSNFVGSPVGGTATLQFDFGAGTLAGHLDPILNPAATPTSLGSYNFVNTVYGVGKANFSGQLSTSGASTNGSFDGQFTGPAAQELMARWSAPYLIPGTQQWSQMFGVWVGKKH